MKVLRINGIGLLTILIFIFFVQPFDVTAQMGPGRISVDQAQDDEGDDFLDDEYYEELEVYDPLEKVNRGIFWFNDKFYFYLAKPVAKAWRFIMPEVLRSSFSNFFKNLGMPVRFANNVLQLRFKDAGIELGRFTINSTLGLGGLFDPARTQFGIRHKPEDFGQTLGHWGVPAGPYFVIPILGPSNIRDGLSLFPDGLIYPTYWWIADSNPGINAGILSGIIMNEISLDKDTYESIVKEQLDPYVFIRDAFMQNREGEIKR